MIVVRCKLIVRIDSISTTLVWRYNS